MNLLHVALNFRPHANWINFQTAKFISELPNIQICFHFLPVFLHRMYFNYMHLKWKHYFSFAFRNVIIIIAFNSFFTRFSLHIEMYHSNNKKNECHTFWLIATDYSRFDFYADGKYISKCTSNCEFKALSILYISNTFNVCGIEYENFIQKLFEKCSICVEVNSLLMLNRSKKRSFKSTLP